MFAMVGMKASLRAPSSSIRKPSPRQACADVDVSELKDKFHAYVESSGIKEAFNLYAYNNMEISNGADGLSLIKKQKLVMLLLQVSPSGAIKFAQLREGCRYLEDTFGLEVFSCFKHFSPSQVAGKVADQLFALLSHVRRVMCNEQRWNETFGRCLHGADLDTWKNMKDFMAQHGLVMKSGASCSSALSAAETVVPQTPAASRQLSAKLSEVSLDSNGFAKVPGMSATVPSPKYDPLLQICMMESPVALKKKPACSLDSTSEVSILKKPASCLKKAVASHSLKKSTTNDFKIIKQTMRVSGGKFQSYIQHVPAGSTKKQLIVAVSDKMVADKSMSHRKVAEALLKWINSHHSPSKLQVVRHRDAFLASL